MAFDWGSLVSALVTILLVSIAIHFGAKPFAKAQHEKFRNAVIVAVLGSLLATLVEGGLSEVLDGIWPRVIGLAAWALVAGIVYRTSWVKGALIGLVSWLLWLGVTFLIGLFL